MNIRAVTPASVVLALIAGLALAPESEPPVIAARAQEAPTTSISPSAVDIPLVNTWVYQTLTFTNEDGSLFDASEDVHGYIQFHANGTYRQELRIGDFNNIYHGSYQLSGDRADLSYTDGDEVAVEVLRFSISGVRLSMRTEGPQPTYYGLQLDGTCHDGICARSGIRQP